MKAKKKKSNSRQLLLRELFVGTLIYAVVLGFFNEYTEIVDTNSFSILFLAAIVLEILTFLTLLLKVRIIDWLISKRTIAHRTLMVFLLSFVLIVSKFVFIWVIDVIFGGAIIVQGFFGTMWLVLGVVIIHKVAEKVFLLPAS